ncbi:hypothetical protein SAMN04515671_0798 [Nakamurella panacisegetis]|uniref:VWFA domain-containing protein n=1 Tax=Nakamurella panacisegetis TaxID=1090615 RepID=A0A1H0J6J7_9ACTN|nr:VWA domain-containing protein [Nakamurella panacisegetis]SDO39337.1 hypothetical protein SAMN04515671_0798 [Nakamurella panacisegetis]
MAGPARGGSGEGTASGDRFGSGSSVDVLVGFTWALRGAGLTVGSERAGTFLAAVARLSALEPDDVYWAGRLTLTASPDDIPVYNAAFEAYFTGRTAAAGRGRSRSELSGLTLSMDADAASGQESSPETTPPVRADAAAAEVLRHRDFAAFSAQDRREMAALLALLAPGLPRRLSRRRVAARRGPVDVRRTVRAMLSSGGEPGALRRRRQGTRARRVVLLIDVSGSMALYADALLRFAHVLTRAQPTATEVFTIGTRLTRITRALRVADPEAALRAAGEVIPDFSGGTRLGEVLRVFTNRWGQRGTARGAVVVLFSDGWERGSADELARQVQRLRRLSRRLVWVNPHKGREGYLPVQTGIVAVLPHLDAFVAGHSLAALEELLEVIRDA